MVSDSTLHMQTLPDPFEHLKRATLFVFTTSFGICARKEIVARFRMKTPSVVQ